jgi:hypothetical protein
MERMVSPSRRHHVYRGAIKHDFLGESHLVNGEWVRQTIHIPDENRRMYGAFGKLYRLAEEARKKNERTASG